MAKTTKITIKQLIMGKKVVFAEGETIVPIAVIGGMTNRKFYRTTDAGPVPYLRGNFWYASAIDGSRGAGEVCVLPVHLAAAIVEKLDAGAPGVEFAYQVSLRKRAKAQVWEPIIEPRVDDVLTRLQGEVARIEELVAPSANESLPGDHDGNANAETDKPGAVSDGSGGAADGAGPDNSSGAGGAAGSQPPETGEVTLPEKAGENAGTTEPAATGKKNRRLGGVAPLTVEPGQR